MVAVIDGLVVVTVQLSFKFEAERTFKFTMCNMSVSTYTLGYLSNLRWSPKVCELGVKVKMSLLHTFNFEMFSSVFTVGCHVYINKHPQKSMDSVI